MLRPPVVLLWLSAITVLFFLLTHLLVQDSQKYRRGLAESWARKGRSALSAHDAATAVGDLRNALLYAPDNSQDRLELAQALLAAGRIEEAQLYFESLWEDEPASGKVNLELARLAVYHHDVAGALRFYHGAIYGLWNDEAESRPREVRLELVDFLLREKFPTLAQSELIALEPAAAADPSLQLRLAARYTQAGDEEGALRVYQKVLRVRDSDPVALAGAGESAFRLSRYTLAQGYLQRAVEAAPNDTRSQESLRVTTLIPELNPYQRGLTEGERAARAVQAFSQAGVLLQSCTPGATGPAAAGPAPDEVRANWMALKPRLSETTLRRNPKLFDQVMGSVDEVAQSVGAGCGEQEALRRALLAVVKEGGESR